MKAENFNRLFLGSWVLLILGWCGVYVGFYAYVVTGVFSVVPLVALFVANPVSYLLPFLGLGLLLLAAFVGGGIVLWGGRGHQEAIRPPGEETLKDKKIDKDLNWIEMLRDDPYKVTCKTTLEERNEEAKKAEIAAKKWAKRVQQAWDQQAWDQHLGDRTYKKEQVMRCFSDDAIWEMAAAKGPDFFLKLLFLVRDHIGMLHSKGNSAVLFYAYNSFFAFRSDTLSQNKNDNWVNIDGSSWRTIVSQIFKVFPHAVLHHRIGDGDTIYDHIRGSDKEVMSRTIGSCIEELSKYQNSDELCRMLCPDGSIDDKGALSNFFEMRSLSSLASLSSLGSLSIQNIEENSRYLETEEVHVQDMDHYNESDLHDQQGGISAGGCDPRAW